MADVDASDVSESWADARADTPTLGEHRSDSEDTLSNLSFENILDYQQELPLDEKPQEGESASAGGGNELKSPLKYPPIPAPRARPRGINQQTQHKSPSPLSPEVEPEGAGTPIAAGGILSTSSSTSFETATANGPVVRVCVTDADIAMVDTVTLDLPLGAQYMPTSVDFSRSPSQLKIQKGEGFMPIEDPGILSEEESSVSSFRAHLDLNLQNGDVRLTKKEFSSTPLSTSLRGSNPQKLLKPQFKIPEINFIQSHTSTSGSGVSSGGEEDDETLSIVIDTDSNSLATPDALDDYIEDFILPLSHESVMSRQLSFRKKVQKQLETVAAERASQELDRFDTMLSTYDEEEEMNLSRSLTPDLKNNPNFIPTPPVPKKRTGSSSSTTKQSSHDPKPKANFDLSPPSKNTSVTVTPGVVSLPHDIELPSLLDIDAIVHENAPNLMGYGRKGSGGQGEFESLPLTANNSASDLESLSNYFLPQQTIDKLYAVYESSNFNNIYCLSGEIKNILSPAEIEEIVANKDHLEKFIDPNVMAALSWSLNEASLPNYSRGAGDNQQNPNDSIKEHNVLNIVKDLTLLEAGLKSKSSSISNGFHSDTSSCEDDNHSTTSSSGDGGSRPSSKVPKGSKEPSMGVVGGGSGSSANKKTVPVRDGYGERPEDNGALSPTGFQRGTPITNSMRRKIALAKGLRSPAPRGQRLSVGSGGDSGINFETESTEDGLKKRTSEESLDDLGVGDDDWEDDIEEERGLEKNSGVYLVRRDSKRFSFKDKDGTIIDRVIEGIFVESKNPNPNGTLRRIRAPLNLTEDDMMGDEDDDSPETSWVDLTKTKEQQKLPQNNFDRLVQEAKSQKQHRKRIPVDEHILSVMSTEHDLDDESQATDITQSDIFHSIMNSNRNSTDEDATMRTETGEDEITLDIDTPDDMEDSIMGPSYANKSVELESIATSPMDRIPPIPLDSQDLDESMRWKSYKVGPADVQIDLQAIHPYRKCLSHGGYFDAEKNVAIILFSGCYLPDRSRKEYTYLMDHLFLYVLSSLEELIVEDYILVYLHGATPKSCMPTFSWLKKCYQLIDHRLRKNLKGLYLVHPTFWLRTVLTLTRPFVSTKFSRKARFINTLSDLCLEIPTEHLVIPDRVLQYDFDLKVDDLKRRKLMS